MAYFPLFTDLEKKNCLIIGGGAIALRKAEALLEFGAYIKVVALDFSKDFLKFAAENSGISLEERVFIPEDLENVFLVIAAANNPALNLHLYSLCSEKNIHINVVDKPELCSFYFPAYVKNGSIVAGVSSGGKSPLIAADIKNNIEIPNYLAALNDQLGTLRNTVKKEVPAKKRRQCFTNLLDAGKKKQTLLTIEEINEIIGRYI